jgi:hypothetical protein
MKENTKGKLFVGMIISVLAFGFATGAGIFVGSNPLNTIGVMNITKEGEFPSIPSTPNNVGTSNNQQSTNTTNPTTTKQTTQTTNTQKTNTKNNTNTQKTDNGNGNTTK